jgi:hypothetical protein
MIQFRVKEFSGFSDEGTDISVADNRTEDFVHGDCLVIPAQEQSAWTLSALEPDPCVASKI